MSFQQNVMKFAKRGEFTLRRHGPSIMTYVGVGGFVATIGLAIRATTKADLVAPKIREQIKDVKDENQMAETMTPKEASERLARAYFDAGKQFGIIYGPTLAVGTASIVLVLGGHGMMVKRQAQMAAVYAALDKSYRAYRARVRQEVGPEKEDELYRRPKMRALDEIELAAAGEGSQTQMIDLSDVLPSPYAKYFDPTSRNWTKEAEYNLIFLRAQELWANDRLRMYGYLFLNEVYDALDLERTQAGQIVGWRLDSDPDYNGDGFVSFGLGDIYDENARAFINGLENIAMLDFNVDGVIRIP